jgi:outer membrane immunogenic protein
MGITAMKADFPPIGQCKFYEGLNIILTANNIPLPPTFSDSLGQVKKAAANKSAKRPLHQVNKRESGMLNQRKTTIIHKMKKTVAICFVLLSSITYSFAQAPLEKGGKQLNAGLGFSRWGVPIYVGLDFGVHPDITIGPQVSFRSFSERYRDHFGNRYSYNHSIIVLAFNGNYHFNRLLEIPSEWDVYAGLTLGYYIWSSPSGYLGDRDSAIGLDAQIGGRYFFSEKFGVNLELGGGTASGGKFGITYKL